MTVMLSQRETLHLHCTLRQLEVNCHAISWATTLGLCLSERSPFPALQVLSLWLHETCRVFQDRLTCQEDHDWFR